MTALHADLEASRATVAALQPLEPALAAAKEEGVALQARITQLEEAVTEGRQKLEDGEAERKILERKHAGVVRGQRRTVLVPKAVSLTRNHDRRATVERYAKAAGPSAPGWGWGWHECRCQWSIGCVEGVALFPTPADD
jgi:hypothetical protein